MDNVLTTSVKCTLCTTLLCIILTPLCTNLKFELLRYCVLTATLFSAPFGTSERLSIQYSRVTLGIHRRTKFSKPYDVNNASPIFGAVRDLLKMTGALLVSVSWPGVEGQEGIKSTSASVGEIIPGEDDAWFSC